MATVPPNLDTPDGSDSDPNKDNRFYLLKTNQKNLLGNRENGEPIAFFDENDLGALHSSALLQKLSPDEFKFGEAGQLKSSWVNYLKSGSETFNFPFSFPFLAATFELTWSTNVDSSDPFVEAKELEVNWANSILSQWNTPVQGSVFGPNVFNTLGDKWVDIKLTLENNANTSKFIDSKDTLETYLNELSTDAITETSLPGSPDTILWSREAHHELGLSPGTILDEINRIYGSKDVFKTNQGTLKSLADSINVFQYDLQSRVGMVIDGVETITGYENINNGLIFESIPDGEDPLDYEPLSYIFPVFDDFQKKVFGELSSDYTLVSGIMYNNSLIKNQTISGLADTPSGNISGMLLVSDGSGFDYVSHTLTGLSDTPTGYISGYYLRSNASGFEYVSPEGFGESISQFTGLSDTPSGYVSYSGQYLVVNDGETGIQFTGIEKIAQDLTDYGFVGGEGSTNFTGLQDTPSDYNNGHYLRSTDGGIEYAEPSALGQDVLTNTTGLARGYLRIDDDGTGIVFVDRETFKEEIDLESDFTGLQDTPSDYSEGDYLRSTSNGLEYVTASGLAQDIGDEIVNNIVTGDLLGFTGLNDTPTDYEEGKFVRVNSAGDAIEYSDVSFLNDVIDAPESQLVSGYLQLDKDGKLVWSPAITDGDVNYTITGATHFTGLLDTPTGYEHGQYLRVHPSEKKLEYISVTGLAEDIGDEIVNNIISNDLLAFTGLNDTPENYIDGSYVQSTADGLIYTDPATLGQDVLTNTTGLASGYLRIDDDGTGIVFVDRETFKEEIDLQSDFTGLLDTPSDYSEGDYLRSTSNGLEYVTASGLAQDIGDEIVNNIITGDLLAFTGLNDTPDSYIGHSGEYVIVNDQENAVHFTGIEKIASDLTDYGFGGGEGSTNFTGLQDTPNNYSDGSYLKSTTNGIEYAGIEPTYYDSITELPASAVSHNGEVVRVGCDLYLSCDGVWKKFTQYQSDTIDDPNDIFPGCVETTAEALQYQEYFDGVMAERNSSSFIDSLNGTSTNIDLKSVCLFKKDIYNSVVWGSEESWTTRGFPNMVGKPFMSGSNDCGMKFKKENDQLFFAVDTINSSSIDKLDLFIGKINDSFQYEEVWRKRVDNDFFRGVADITDDFKHIIHSQNRDGGNVNTRDIYVLDYNESTQSYDENRPPITVELTLSLYDLFPLNHSQSKLGNYTFRISQDGKRVFVMAQNGDAFSTQLRLFIFEWNDAEWTLPHVMTMPSPSDGAATVSSINFNSFRLNEDETLIYLIAGNYNSTPNFPAGGVFEINYENNSMNIQVGQNLFNNEFAGPQYINNLGNVIMTYRKSRENFIVWKYNNDTELWEEIHRFAKSGEYHSAGMCRNGKFFMHKDESSLSVYFYNESSKSMIKIAQSLGTSVSSNSLYAISDSGQSIAYGNNTATIPLSQIPEVEGDIYNNSVSIQESSYKWGLFEENATINLGGTIDTNCTFTEWQTSDVTLADLSNINSTAHINQDASITGVFNCG